MEELVGRLTTLDPDASASLKVIVYFDSLVDGHAGLEAFLRGAAILTGCPAGVVDPDRRLRMRVDDRGSRTQLAADPSPPPWPSRPLGHGEDAHVWIERDGQQHANDAMVLERLAWGLRMTIERAESRLPAESSVGVEILLDPASPPGERQRAAHRLHLSDTEPVRAIAVPPDALPSTPRELSTIMPTVAGPVRAILETRSSQAAGRPPAARAGIGSWTRVSELAPSWNSAVTALRFTGVGTPVVHADELGALAVLARGVDAHPEPIAEVEMLDAITATSAWAAETLEALGSHDSVRAAAGALNVHHSTVQSRCEHLEAALGYNLRTQQGRARVALALNLQKLVHNSFG